MYQSAGGATSWFGARTVVAVVVVATVCLAAAGQQAQAQSQDGCKIECYPNTKLINGKGGAGKGDNCRWILRTDGKAARLCDHIKCKKVCPNNQAASSLATSGQDQQSAASDNMRIEQQTEAESPNSATGANTNDQPMGIMRQMHGNKLAKAPVPGVAGGRLSQQPAPSAGPSSASGVSGGRRMAPTLPPQGPAYDENDTPPPISRFLDISPEE